MPAHAEPRTDSITRELARGGLAGLLATIPMTFVLEGTRRAMPWWRRPELEPQTVTRRLLAALGASSTTVARHRDSATVVSHFGFGATAGALYGVLLPRVIGGGVARAAAYGVGVFAASYLGWLPALSLFDPRPARDLPATRAARLVAAHVVWGAALGVLASAPRRPARPRTDRSAPERLTAPRVAP